MTIQEHFARESNTTSAKDTFLLRALSRQKALASLGEDFRRLRKASGFSQAQVAQIAKTTQSVVSRFETARRGASFDLASRLADAIGATLSLGSD